MANDKQDWKMLARTDNDYDLSGDGLIVELSRDPETGKWTFWAVRFEGTEDRIGSIDRTLPPDVTSMLDERRDAIESAGAVR